MRAELRSIEPITESCDWEEFARNPSPTPWDDYGSFTLSIGAAGGTGADLFDITVATDIASCRLQGKGMPYHGIPFHGMLVESFEPDVIAKSLHENVSSLESTTWLGLVKLLSKIMTWEYEEMEAVELIAKQKRPRV